MSLPDPRTKPFLSPEEALTALDLPLGRTAWYEAIRRGDVPGARKIGSRWLLSTQALHEWAGPGVAFLADEIERSVRRALGAGWIPEPELVEEIERAIRDLREME